MHLFAYTLSFQFSPLHLAFLRNENLLSLLKKRVLDAFYSLFDAKAAVLHSENGTFTW